MRFIVLSAGEGLPRRGFEMKRLRITGLGALLVVASTAAWAFQEQQSGGAQAPRSSSPAVEVVPGVAVAPAGGDAVVAPRSGGTEIRIPGLGSLGVLPKMDFGLELLYGAAEQKSSDESRSLGNGADDLAIKGTIRKKF